MLNTQTFETQINLTNINDIYDNNLDDLLLNQLKNKYENNCYKSSFIVTVDKIINRSLPTVNKRSLTAYVNIFMIFEATVLHFDYLDVIVNNDVVDISNSRVICKSENKAILINNKSKILDSIKVNQNIPIIVGKCSYSMYKNVISINCYPFIPSFIVENKNNIYYKIEQLSKNDKDLLNSTIINNINSEIELKNTLLKVKNNRWEYFSNLLYPYKKKFTNEKIQYISNVDLLNLNSEGIVSLLNEQPLTAHNISIIDYEKYNKNKKTNNDSIVSNGSIDNPIVENSLVVYQIYLTKYYKNLKLIRELSETYYDDKIFDDNKNVFDIYENNKL
jgi:hypothetical protein